MGFPCMTSETLAVDRRYLVLQYYVVEITYSQQVFDIKDWFKQFHVS